MLLPYFYGVGFSLYSYFTFVFMIYFWILRSHKLHDILTLYPVLLAQLNQEDSNGLLIGWRRHGKTSWKHLLGVPRRKWERNTKMHLRENDCEEGR